MTKIQTDTEGTTEKNSRIRFNPDTKEIEVEGTEECVKAYFEKLQAMIPGSQGKAKKTVPTEEVEKDKPSKKQTTNIGKVVALVQGSPEGISTAELKEKTGLNERQIWSIVNRAAKEGRIRKGKRGLYRAA